MNNRNNDSFPGKIDLGAIKKNSMSSSASTQELQEKFETIDRESGNDGDKSSVDRKNVKNKNGNKSTSTVGNGKTREKSDSHANGGENGKKATEKKKNSVDDANASDVGKKKLTPKELEAEKARKEKEKRQKKKEKEALRIQKKKAADKAFKQREAERAKKEKEKQRAKKAKEREKAEKLKGQQRGAKSEKATSTPTEKVIGGAKKQKKEVNQDRNKNKSNSKPSAKKEKPEIHTTAVAEQTTQVADDAAKEVAVAALSETAREIAPDIKADEQSAEEEKLAVTDAENTEELPKKTQGAIEQINPKPKTEKKESANTVEKTGKLIVLSELLKKIKAAIPKKKGDKSKEKKGSGGNKFTKALAGIRAWISSLCKKISASRFGRLVAAHRLISSIVALVLVAAIVILTIFAARNRGLLNTVEPNFTYIGILDESHVRDITITDEQQQARIDELERHGQTTKFDFFANTDIYFDEWFFDASLILGNPSKNECILIASMFDEEGVLVFRSDGIAPGKYLPTMRLSEDFSAGEYETRLYVSAYDPDSYKLIGIQYTDVTLFIGGNNNEQQEEAK